MENKISEGWTWVWIHVWYKIIKILNFSSEESSSEEDANAEDEDDNCDDDDNDEDGDEEEEFDDDEEYEGGPSSLDSEDLGNSVDSGVFSA